MNRDCFVGASRLLAMTEILLYIPLHKLYNKRHNILKKVRLGIKRELLPSSPPYNSGKLSTAVAGV